MTQHLDHLRSKPVECEQSVADTVRWSVSDGTQVQRGQVIGSVGALEMGNYGELTAPRSGVFRTKPLASRDESTEQATDSKVIVANIEYCIHPLMNGRTCMMCLAIVDEAEAEGDGETQAVNVISHGQVIRLNVEEAKRFDLENIKRQLITRKLSLVLDLDHTLLHAVRVMDVVGEIPKTDDIHFFYIPGLPNQQHVVKLRPGLKHFLQDLSKHYDLFIYTHGTRLYAEQITRIIDPDDKIFHHRIVARTDTPEMGHKSLKLLFPSCDDSMILVLDDRIDVWRENEGNVFLIEPYHFFRCTAEINNASGKGVGGAADDSSGIDSHLTHAMSVLKTVHRSFYEDSSLKKTLSAEDQMAGRGRDVKSILSMHKRSVLKGCYLVFSGIFPIDARRGPETHHIWKLAVDLGAVPSVVLDDFPITHLVINPARLGTQKHMQARSMPGVQVVTPEWVFKCARTWSRVSEKDFLADEWKQKQEQMRKAAEKSSEETSTNQVGAIVSEEPSETPSSTTSEVNVSSPEATIMGTPAVEAETTAPSSDVNDSSIEKEKKRVTFAPDTKVNDASSETGRQQNKPGRRLPHRPGRVIRRPQPPPQRMGLVASGGTIDFLAKITSSRSSSSRQPQAVPHSSDLKKATAQSKISRPTPTAAPAPKDIDDTLDRLLAAEEEDSKVEQKRKLESTDVKDQLAQRRHKKSKSEAEDKHGDEDDGDDEDLDLLEQDILGDL